MNDGGDKSAFNIDKTALKPHVWRRLEVDMLDESPLQYYNFDGMSFYIRKQYTPLTTKKWWPSNTITTNIGFDNNLLGIEYQQQ